MSSIDFLSHYLDGLHGRPFRGAQRSEESLRGYNAGRLMQPENIDGALATNAKAIASALSSNNALLDRALAKGRRDG